MLKKIRKYAALPAYDLWNLIELFLYRLKGQWFYRRVFAGFGENSAIFPPMLLSGAKNVHIGKNVIIRRGVRIEAVLSDPDNPPEIRIGDNVNIEQNVHIVALGKIIIHDDVSITANCSIMCGSHPFFDIHDPRKIGDRLADAKSTVEIGAGSMLGIGTIIKNNVRLGQKVVVGSGSVVKESAPDFCVVDGNPGVVVMQYDLEKQGWRRGKRLS